MNNVPAFAPSAVKDDMMLWLLPNSAHRALRAIRCARAQSIHCRLHKNTCILPLLAASLHLVHAALVLRRSPTLSAERLCKRRLCKGVMDAGHQTQRSAAVHIHNRSARRATSGAATNSDARQSATHSSEGPGQCTAAWHIHSCYEGQVTWRRRFDSWVSATD